MRLLGGDWFQSAAAILGGNDSVTGCSIFCAEPLEIFTCTLHDKDPFEKLRQTLSKYTKKGSDPFFPGGWIGYFGYELGRFIETLPGRAVDALGLPMIYLAFYDKAILYDHARRQYILTILELEGENKTPEAKFQRLLDWIAEAEALAAAASDLPALKAAIEGFEGSPLKQLCEKTVVYDGTLGAPVMVLGEGPGGQEDGVGLPFVGKAGQLLDKMLAAQK